MGKLNKKDIYYGCDSYDFEYFQPKPPKTRLQKLGDGFYTRHKRKGMFYHIADLDDTKYIFNVTKIKSKIRITRKNPKVIIGIKRADLKFCKKICFS